MYLTCSTVWQNIYRHPGSEKLTMSWRAKLWLTCTRCCNDFARKGLQHMWPGACQSLCFLWQFLVCKVASNAEQRTFGISEVCLLALGVYTPQPQKVPSPCLYNRSCLQSSWLLQEHSLVADRHCGAKCFHVALGGFYGSDLHLRGISGAGLLHRRHQNRTVANASCWVFPCFPCFGTQETIKNMEKAAWLPAEDVWNVMNSPSTRWVQ